MPSMVSWGMGAFCPGQLTNPAVSTGPGTSPAHKSKDSSLHNLYQMLKLGPRGPEPAVMLHYP